jgi:hypothetical protein
MGDSQRCGAGVWFAALHNKPIVFKQNWQRTRQYNRGLKVDYTQLL